MVPDITVSFVFGVLYGYRRPGKEDRAGLMKSGAKWGLVIGLGFGLLDYFTAYSMPRLVGLTFGWIIGIIILTIAFVLGTVIGDFLEVKFKK